jgi:hypothetical protein
MSDRAFQTVDIGGGATPASQETRASSAASVASLGGGAATRRGYPVRLPGATPTSTRRSPTSIGGAGSPAGQVRVSSIGCSEEMTNGTRLRRRECPVGDFTAGCLNPAVASPALMRNNTSRYLDALVERRGHATRK